MPRVIGFFEHPECGALREPAVVYIDEDRVPRRVAGSFEQFISGLVAGDEFEDVD